MLPYFYDSRVHILCRMKLYKYSIYVFVKRKGENAWCFKLVKIKVVCIEECNG